MLDGSWMMDAFVGLDAELMNACCLLLSCGCHLPWPNPPLQKPLEIGGYYFEGLEICDLLWKYSPELLFSSLLSSLLQSNTKHFPSGGKEDSSPTQRKPKEYSSSSSAWRLPSAPRRIPNAGNNNSSSAKHETKIAQQSSAPLNIPDWSKIYGHGNMDSSSRKRGMG
ncbi:hypothetical protein V6N13_059182 [Hibiscus sabdariffa]